MKIESFVGYVMLTLVTGGLFFANAQGQETPPSVAWNQFRGPDANPIAENPELPERWSATENIEWSTKLEGRGWSSPIVVGNRVFVTTAVTSGKSKPPQAGTEYSNDYVRELAKQGLSQDEIKQKVFERDFELPDQVSLKYFLVCLDLNSGREIWRQKFFEGHPPGGRHRKNSFASETPTTDGQRVFVYIGNMGLFAFDLDGKALWKQPIEAKPIYMEFGTGSSPVICDGQLIVLNDNEESSFIASFDPETGKEIWRTARTLPKNAPAQLPKSGWSTPFVWKNKVRTEIVTVQPGRAISYDTKGNELWQLKGCSPAPAASSFAHNDILYLNGGRGAPIYAIKPGAEGEIKFVSSADKPAAEKANDKSAQDTDQASETPVDSNPSNACIVWRRPRAGTYIPTPVLYQGGLYIVQDNGILQRLELGTGSQSYKERIKKSGADFTTSPWAYNGKVFCLSEQGDTYVFEAGQEFKLSHVNSLGQFSMATPAIVGGRLLIRTEDAIYSIRKL